MGKVLVPEDAYYGAQTQWAVDNFPISSMTMPLSFIHSLALVKKCAAKVNETLGVFDSQMGHAIVQAAQEVMDGRLFKIGDSARFLRVILLPYLLER